MRQQIGKFRLDDVGRSCNIASQFDWTFTVSGWPLKPLAAFTAELIAGQILGPTVGTENT